jgi:2-alkyl-3-oxoalkanoate reductase
MGGEQTAMKVLVTGGGGFLGKAIVERLVKRGCKVRSLSRSIHSDLDKSGVDSSLGDLADAGAVERAVDGCELVFHVAAKPGVWGRYHEYYLPNVVGTNNILAACRKYGVKKLVYTSTPSVVHSGRNLENADESLPYAEHFETHYPRTKAEAEQAVLAAAGPELATVALRPHLIWGPGDNHLVPRIVSRWRSGRLRRTGSMETLVDATYIDNAADAHLLAADRLAIGSPISGKAYFIANGEPMPIWTLIDGILAAAGLPPVKKTIPFWMAYSAGAVLEGVYSLLRRKDEPMMTRFVAKQLATSHWFDLSAAKRDLGYEPKVTTMEGLERLKKWFREMRPAV